MAGLVTNPMAQAQQGQAQQEGLSSQTYQQNLMDTILGHYLALSRDPSAQNANVNYMTGNSMGTSGGLYGNLASAMNGVAGTVPGTVGGMNPAVMNQVLGQFQQPVTSGASSLYYNALKNALGINPPTVGSQNQMILGNPAFESAVTGAGQNAGSVLAQPGNQTSTLSDYNSYPSFATMTAQPAFP